MTTCWQSAVRPRPSIRPLILTLINKAREEDPEAAEAEWDGGFRRDIAAFLTDHDIDAAVDYDRPMELPPRHGLKLSRFADPVEVGTMPTPWRSAISRGRVTPAGLFWMWCVARSRRLIRKR